MKYSLQKPELVLNIYTLWWIIESLSLAPAQSLDAANYQGKASERTENVKKSRTWPEKYNRV